MRRGIDDHTRSEAAERKQAVLHHMAQALEIETRTEHHHTDDHHQVARCVHAQPGRIDRRDTLAACREHRHHSLLSPTLTDDCLQRSVRSRAPQVRTYDSFRSALVHPEELMSDLKTKFEQAVRTRRTSPARTT